jgi:hypothetical protein
LKFPFDWALNSNCTHFFRINNLFFRVWRKTPTWNLISSLSIVFFCLFSSSYASNLELPEITQNMGMKTIKIWLWELDPSVDDRDDIEKH